MPRKFADIDLSGLKNRSILIVDDTHSVHRDYRAVLRPNPNEGEENELDRLESLLLGADSPAPTISRCRNFTLQSTHQGEEAYELVKKHLRKGIRYPLAFVDMRMPPGWDGLETIQNLRALDPEMRFVIVTAYSDYSDDELDEQIGDELPVKIVRKPFNPREIYQLAYDILADWNAAQPDNG